MSTYFSPKEYECNCGCGFNTMAKATLVAADAIRSALGKPIRVNSGCRCVDHNKKVGGAKASWHLPRYAKHMTNEGWVGHAMDLGISGDDQQKAVDLLELELNKITYIRYNTFLHIDSRPNRYVGDNR